MMRLRATLAALSDVETGRWQRVLTAIRWFVYEADVQVVEVTGCLASLYWMAVLSMPGDLFAATPAFARLDAAFGQTTWTVFSAIAGILPLAALWFGSLHLRRIALLWQVWFFAIIAAAIGLVSPLNTGTGVYGIFAFGAAWGHWRLRPRIR